MTATSARPQIFILALTEEMGSPYAEYLGKHGMDVQWFANARGLLTAASTGRAPAVIVIDLDTTGEPTGELGADVRAAFPGAELVALSSTDSSRLAMLALRCGFSDFLLKPISPEQLAWTLQHCCEHRERVTQWQDPKAQWLQAMLAISASTSPLLVRIETLKYLRTLFSAKGASWHSGDARHKALASVPSGTRPSARGARPGIFVLRGTGLRRLVLAARNGELVVLSGIPQSVGARRLREARAVVEHGTLALRNLEKLARIQRQTFVDDLTGLYNSRYLKFALAEAVSRCRRQGGNFAVLFLDLDKFKSVNDRFGHTVGSDLLVALARTLKNSLRSKDPLFRYGGDEFVVILRNTGLEKAYEIAERLRALMERKTFAVRGHQLQVTVSIGIAVYPDHAPEHQTLLRLADEAMYAAKKHQRNAVRLAIDPNAPATPPPKELAE